MLVAERATAEYFEKAGATGRDPKAAANWVMGDLFGALNRLGLGIEQSPVAAEQLGALIDLIADGTISGRIAKDVFAEMVETGADPARDRRAKGLRQVSDTGAIEAAVDAALAANPAQVAQYAHQPEGARLLCRPGHEGDRRQGQPRARQRDAAQEAERGTVNAATHGHATRR